jgi:hypothetical protein
LAPCLSLGAIFGNLDFDLNPGWRCTENSASFADRRNNALGQRQIRYFALAHKFGLSLGW